MMEEINLGLIFSPPQTGMGIGVRQIFDSLGTLVLQ